ncbi:MAG: DUF4410 domain-containing protein [Pseudomonadales bacterium]
MRYSIILAVLLMTGCGTTHHAVNFNSGYTPSDNPTITVGNTTNNTGETFDINIESMLNDALSKELSRSNLLAGSGDISELSIDTEILEYKKGDAFKRWLVPGYGSTVLNIKSKLLNSASEVVGTVEARRTVDAGGGYTIGEWETIFPKVAEDIVRELSKELTVKPNRVAEGL